MVKEVEPQEVIKEISMSEEIDIENILSIFDCESEVAETLKEEFAKEDSDKDFSIIVNSMAKLAQTLFDANTELSETNSLLQEFKDSVRKERFESKVTAVINKLKERVEIPAKAIKEMQEESKKFNLDTIEEWTILCKAKAFNYATADPPGKTEVIGVPWLTLDGDKSVWENL